MGKEISTLKNIDCPIYNFSFDIDSLKTLTVEASTLLLPPESNQ